MNKPLGLGTLLSSLLVQSILVVKLQIVVCCGVQDLFCVCFVFGYVHDSFHHIHYILIILYHCSGNVQHEI